MNMCTDLAAARLAEGVDASWQPDIVHAHGTRAAFYTSLCGAHYHCPVVYTAHGLAFRDRQKPLRRAQEAGEGQRPSDRPGRRRDTAGNDRVQRGRAVDPAQPSAGRPADQEATQVEPAGLDEDHEKWDLPSTSRGGRDGLQEAHSRKRTDASTREGQGAGH